MPGLIEIPEELEKATAEQRVRTKEALRRGVPIDAATPEQRAARSAYKRKHWPVILDETVPPILDDVVREGVWGGKDDTLWSSYLARGVRCAKAVARVVWKDRSAESRWQGTAFLISDWVAVTNNHVLDSPAAAAAAALEFNYEYGEDGAERRIQLVELNPDRLFLTDQRDGGIDYTVVALKTAGSAARGRSRGYLPLIAERGKAQNGDAVNLIHHPAGMRKRVTMRESRLLGMDERTLHYSGDTLGGSSGAPVLNDQWEVVGLHFGGKPKRDADGRRLTVKGTVWNVSMPEESIDYEFNVAMRVSTLVRELRAGAEAATPEGRELLFDAIGRDR